MQQALPQAGHARAKSTMPSPGASPANVWLLASRRSSRAGAHLRSGERRNTR